MRRMGSADGAVPIRARAAPVGAGVQGLARVYAGPGLLVLAGVGVDWIAAGSVMLVCMGVGVCVHDDGGLVGPPGVGGRRWLLVRTCG